MYLGIYRDRDSLGLLDFGFFRFLSDLVRWQIFDGDDTKFVKLSLKAKIMSENKRFFVKCS